MKTWWQVYRPDKPVFGFSSTNGIVDNKFPDYRYQGATLTILRQWCSDNSAKVVKIGEQCLQ